MLSKKQLVILQIVKRYMDIYTYNNYRDFVKAWEQKTSIRGARSQLAKASKTSPSWITRVLNGEVQLTPDHALGIATFFGFNEHETDYFLLLIDLERAASTNLKLRIQEKLDKLKNENRKIASSIKLNHSFSPESSNIYYSSWIYSVIHVACMIKPQSIFELAQILRLSEITTLRFVNELVEIGVLKKEGIYWASRISSIHLPSNLPNVKTIHSSWRNHTIQRLHEGDDSGLHYSAVHCLSQADIDNIHLMLKKAIMRCRQVIENSPSEVMSVLCMDWYKL